MALTHSQRKIEKRNARRRRIRAKVVGTSARPRLSVYKSNTGIYAQIVDDSKGLTLVASAPTAGKSKSKLEKAKEIGTLLAKAAQAKGISTVVFDRGGFLYSGRIKAFAESARAGGLIF